MRSIRRTTCQLVPGASLICVAVALIGVVYGATAVNAGLPVWFAPLIGTLVLAGASEMLFIGILTGGASPWIAAAAALAVNARHIPYGLAVNDVLGHGWRRVVRIHLVNDESVVFARDRASQVVRQRAFTLVGIGILIAWPAGAFVGGIAGSALDVSVIGLDAVFPAVIVALTISALRDRRTRSAYVVAAVVAVVATPLLPAGTAPLAGLVALVMLWRKVPTDA